MSKQLDNQGILKRMQKYSEKGVNFNFNQPNNNMHHVATCSGPVLMTAFDSKDSMLSSHVRMTDPNINQRVSIHVEIFPEDELKDLDFKLKLIDKLLEQAEEINKHKEAAEQLAEKQREEDIAQAKARHELNKKSPILFDFLYANTFQEEQAQQGIFPVIVEHISIMSVGKSAPELDDEDEDYKPYPKSKKMVSRR